MESLSPIEEIYEEEKYLKEGPQTPITPEIKQIADKLPPRGEQFITEANRWIATRVKTDSTEESKSEVFRKRTAGQIVADGYSTGCTDDALVFISLARAKGMPARYVEAVRKDSDGRAGHVFVEAFVNSGWVKVDPARREFKRGLDYGGYDIIAKGLDSWDVGTGSVEEIISKTAEYRNSKN